MELQPFAFFARIEPIKKSSDLFEIFKTQGFYFYYFQSNKFYYLFVYGKHHLFNSFNSSILPSLIVIEELDTKKRKIRSIRGFLLYAWETIQDEKLITVLETNFHPLFWRRLKDIMKQNKQGSLVNFLFGSSNFSYQDVLQGIKELHEKFDRLEKVLEQLISKSGQEPVFSSGDPSRTATDELSQRELESANSEALVATK